MAKFLPILSSHFIIFSMISLISAQDHEIADKKFYGFNAETFTHIHLFWHDVLSGSKPTAIQVVPPVSNTSTAFGLMNMIDDALTEGPERSSKLLGRAQGFYVAASLEEVGLLMAMNFAFSEGKFNGSTITVLGRNAVFSKVREMPVIGGTGVFRFARGFVQAKTYKFDPNTGDAVVEYNCYVLHY
ncbi:Dirigent protein [Melia azedarach]|uniref:Dirigent protein n=1 Tax=Melia azedarach TaxID=155640 RepID=A0ACC1YL39_MELAZ|nr:Dirigent protein [Melia azedarach]